MFLKTAQVHSKTAIFYSIIYLILKIKKLAVLKISQLNQDIIIFYFSFLNFVHHNKKYRFEKHFI
jgi:hypothetical protein